MADMIHGWWLDHAYVETNVDFEPLLDSNGNPIAVQYVESGYYARFGNIITSQWRFAELRAVTVGVGAPSTSGLIATSGASEGSLVVGGPQSSAITIEPLADSEWEQYNSVDTTLADGILNLFAHTVTFRCGTRTVTQGMYNELDTPPVPPPVE